MLQSIARQVRRLTGAIGIQETLAGMHRMREAADTRMADQLRTVTTLLTETRQEMAVLEQRVESTARQTVSELNDRLAAFQPQPPAEPSATFLPGTAGTPSMVGLPSGAKGLFVPLDHEHIVHSRTGDFVYESVRALFDDQRAEIDAFLAEIAPFLNHPTLDAVTDEADGPTKPYWNNGYFTGDDARAAFAIVAARRPAQVVEIGSGNSTRFFRRAIDVCSPDTRLVSIDPEPRADIQGIATEIIRASVLDAPLDLFRAMQPGDVLFHDGSHVTFNGVDTVRLFLEILPVLPVGVLVHLHDITLPFEYPAVFTERAYSEQYMLAAALLNGGHWRVRLPVRWLHARGMLPDGGVSFWMERQA